jgi:hypothetical protein
MGLLGGVLLLGGLGTAVMGIIGVIAGLVMGEWFNALLSLGWLVGGLIAGAAGTAILE